MPGKGLKPNNKRWVIASDCASERFKQCRRAVTVKAAMALGSCACACVCVCERATWKHSYMPGARDTHLTQAAIERHSWPEQHAHILTYNVCHKSKEESSSNHKPAGLYSSYSSYHQDKISLESNSFHSDLCLSLDLLTHYGLLYTP